MSALVAQGYHGDTSAMVACGTISKQAQRLCDTTKEALDAAIAICRPGQQTKRIGAACAAVADRNK
jgi:methionyl aminopeptidase